MSYDVITGSRAIPCDFTSGDCEYRYYVALDDEGNPLPIHFDDDSGKENRLTLSTNKTTSKIYSFYIFRLSRVGGPVDHSCGTNCSTADHWINHTGNY